MKNTPFLPPLGTLTVACLLAAFGSTLLQSAPAAADEQKQIAILQSNAPLFDKDVACRELARIGSKQAVPALAALLTHERLSHMARTALEQIPDTSVDDALRATLGKVQGRLRVGIINSIGTRRDAKAVNDLASFLNDADADIAGAAALSLGKIAGDAAMTSLQQALASAPENRKSLLAEGCLWCGKTFVEQGKVPEAARMYAFVRKAKVPPYIAAAASRDELLLQGQDGARLLAEMLVSPDREMFNAALLAARQVPGPKISDTLVSQFKNLNADRRALVLTVLGDRHDPAAKSVVLETARTGEPAARVSALKVLAQMGDASVVPTLFEAATGADKSAAAAARNTLAMLPGKDVDAAIVAAVQKGSDAAKVVAIESLAPRRLGAANAALVALVAGAAPELRAAALHALNETGSAAEVDGLLAILLKSTEKRDLEAVESTLKNVCTRVAAKSALSKKFLAPLGSADVAHKTTLLRLLSASGGDEALQAVRAAAKDAAPEIQDTGFRALCDWTDLGAAPDLIQVAKTAPKLAQKVLALRGYLRLASEVETDADKKWAMCQAAAAVIERPDEKKLLLGAVAGVPKVEALAMAKSYVSEPAIKGEAVLAVLAIGNLIVDKNPKEVGAVVQAVLPSLSDKRMSRRANELLERAGVKAPATHGSAPAKEKRKKNK